LFKFVEKKEKEGNLINIRIKLKFTAWNNVFASTFTQLLQ
jgi:hypothetical protein